MLLKKIKYCKEIKPRFLGLHLEGPYLSLNQKGAIPEKNIKDPDKEEYLSILNHSNDIIRWTIAPERTNALELGDELKRRGIKASIGHSDAIDQEVYAACEHGFNCVTHIYSMTSGVIRKNCYRYAGINETAYLCDSLYTEAICDGHHLPDTLIKLIYKNKGSDKMVLVTDSMSAAGLGEGMFYLGNPKDDQKVVVKGGVAFMPDMSSFAGSVATSDQLLKTMIRVGLPLTEIIKMMTITPAKLLDAEQCLGFKPSANIEKGETNASGYYEIFKQMAQEFNFKYVVSTLRESYSATHNGWKALIYNGKEFYESKHYDINPIVDRVGGGDSFSGGIIHGLLTKETQSEALEFAVAASSLKHTINGDFNLVSIEEGETLVCGDS